LKNGKNSKKISTTTIKKDNNFTEMRDAEILRERLGVLQTVDPYIGRYYSMEWVQKNVLQMDKETIAVNEETDCKRRRTRYWWTNITSRNAYSNNKLMQRQIHQ